MVGSGPAIASTALDLPHNTNTTMDNKHEQLWDKRETAIMALDLIRSMSDHIMSSDDGAFRYASIDAHAERTGRIWYRLNCIIGGDKYASDMVAAPYERAPILAQDGTVLVGQDGIVRVDCWRAWSAGTTTARSEMGYGEVYAKEYDEVTHYRKGDKFPTYL